MCRRGARMELRPPEPRPPQSAPPLGHESSLSAYRAWFVEVVLRASGVPDLVAENMRVIEECASDAGKFYQRRERLAGSGANDISEGRTSKYPSARILRPDHSAVVVVCLL